MGRNSYKQQRALKGRYMNKCLQWKFADEPRTPLPTDGKNQPTPQPCPTSLEQHAICKNRHIQNRDRHHESTPPHLNPASLEQHRNNIIPDGRENHTVLATTGIVKTEARGTKNHHTPQITSLKQQNK